MKSTVISVLLTVVTTLITTNAAPIAHIAERAPPIRYVSPTTSLVTKWISTANVTQASIDYAKALLALDKNIETVYKGDGNTEPTTPYNPYVNVSKNGVPEVIGASGSASAASADVTLMTNWAQMATAAYCDTSAISSWTCATCRQNTYGKPSSIVTAEQDDSRFYGGYISTTNSIFIAFRGSSNAANWITNLDFGTDPYWNSDSSAPSNARFHAGFQKLYSKLSDTVRALVTNLATQNPTASITFTGHSLGGALAMHSALDLAVTNYVSQLTPAKIQVFTQGEPRIGNKEASIWTTGQGWAGLYRAVNYDDIVPHLPYKWMGFRHHQREWWILKGGSNVVTCDDVNRSDNEDSNCFNSIVFASGSSHGLYFSVPMGSGC